ncbi:MAG: hypothetical protein KCHDKBKB_02991 [Elusimicrobia bacterium]|nr:hypothetical protein [Elusimicrobiota bacterium]
MNAPVVIGAGALGLLLLTNKGVRAEEPRNDNWDKLFRIKAQYSGKPDDYRPKDFQKSQGVPLEAQKLYILNQYSFCLDAWANAFKLNRNEFRKKPSLTFLAYAAQTAFETAYGTMFQAPFNVANLTATKNEKNVIEGKDKNASGQTITQKFAVFDSYTACAERYIAFLSTFPRYKNSWKLFSRVHNELNPVEAKSLYMQLGSDGYYEFDKSKYGASCASIFQKHSPTIESAISAYTEGKSYG